jgi:uncharacterized protein (UPF0335 family)
MSKPGHNSKVQAGPIAGDRLKSFVERIERMEEERKAIGADIRDIYAEAKGVGYDVKTVRWVVQERRVNAADRAERDTLRDVYQRALDTAVGLVRGGLSLREAGRLTGTSKSSIHRALAVPEVSQPAPHDADGVITETPAPQGLSFPRTPEAAGASPPVVTLDLDGGERSSTHSADDMPEQPAFLRRGTA